LTSSASFLQALLLPHNKVLQMQSNKLSGHPVICQLLSFVPKELVKKAAEKFEAEGKYQTISAFPTLKLNLDGCQLELDMAVIWESLDEKNS